MGIQGRCGLQTQRKEHGGPVHRVGGEDVLAHQVVAGRPAPGEVIGRPIGVVADGCAVVQQRMIESLNALAKRVDAMVLLEQVDEPDTGVFTGGVTDALSEIRRERPDLLMLADSRRGLGHFPAVGLKMNREEFGLLTGQKAEVELPELCLAVGRLADERGEAVFVSLSEDGIAGARPGEQSEHMPCLPVRGEIDVVGAGDAVMANLTTAIAAGAETSEAMRLAMAAASIVVHQLGTTGTASLQDIRSLGYTQ